MRSLFQRSRRTGFALVLSLGLTILPGIVTPLLSDDLASWMPGTAEVLADESMDGGGG